MGLATFHRVGNLASASVRSGQHGSWDGPLPYLGAASGEEELQSLAAGVFATQLVLSGSRKVWQGLRQASGSPTSAAMVVDEWLGRSQLEALRLATSVRVTPGSVLELALEQGVYVRLLGRIIPELTVVAFTRLGMPGSFIWQESGPNLTVGVRLGPEVVASKVFQGDVLELYEQAADLAKLRPGDGRLALRSGVDLQLQAQRQLQRWAALLQLANLSTFSDHRDVAVARGVLGYAPTVRTVVRYRIVLSPSMGLGIGAFGGWHWDKLAQDRVVGVTAAVDGCGAVTWATASDKRQVGGGWLAAGPVQLGYERSLLRSPYSARGEAMHTLSARVTF